MMQLIRSNVGKTATIVLVGGFLAWMVYGIGMEVTGQGGGRPGQLGSVNGTPITQEAYQRTIQDIEARLRSQGERVGPEQRAQIEQDAWTQLVNEILTQQELDRRHIRVTDDEIRFAALTEPVPELARQEIFQTNGQFDPAKYRQYLSSNNASDELLSNLEQYYRGQIPRMKLAEQITSGVYVSDAQLWQLFRDRNEKVSANFVMLDLSKLAPQAVQVSDGEIRDYYNAHKEDFKRPRTARFTVAYLSTEATPADQEAVHARALQLRATLAANPAAFADSAKAISSDTVSGRQGGSLGTVRHGQMVAAFDSAVWALPVNEISQPVLTQFGWHVIQVTARGGDSAVVRHILLPLTKSDAQMETIGAKADTLSKLAAQRGLEYAARSVGATLRQGVTVTDALPYIPGVGQAGEALDWAAGEAATAEPGQKPLSDVFEGQQGLYMVRLESYFAKGTMTLAEAAPQIRETLILRKKRDAARAAGEKIVAEVRGGKTLQQAAAEHGLAVQQAGPFGRMDPNPALGQASAAVGAAFGTPVGQVSGVVETEGGLFIVQPTQHVAADPRQFGADRERLRQALIQQLRQRAIDRWLDSARKAADIRDNRDQLQAARSS
jgi:peptidyl-prolyl cis-trans isomerase D